MFSLNTLFLFYLLLVATLFGKTVPNDILGPTEEEKICVTRIKDKCYKTIPTLKLAKHEEEMGEDYYAEEMYKGLCEQGDGNGCLALSKFYSKNEKKVDSVDYLHRACDLGIGDNCLQPYLARIDKEKKLFKHLAIKDTDPEKEIYGPNIPFYFTYGPRSTQELTYGPARDEPKTETRTIAATTDTPQTPSQIEVGAAPIVVVAPTATAPLDTAEQIFSAPKYFIIPHYSVLKNIFISNVYFKFEGLFIILLFSFSTFTLAKSRLKPIDFSSLEKSKYRQEAITVIVLFILYFAMVSTLGNAIHELKFKTELPIEKLNQINLFELILLGSGYTLVLLLRGRPIYFLWMKLKKKELQK